MVVGQFPVVRFIVLLNADGPTGKLLLIDTVYKPFYKVALCERQLSRIRFPFFGVGHD